MERYHIQHTVFIKVNSHITLSPHPLNTYTFPLVHPAILPQLLHNYCVHILQDCKCFSFLVALKLLLTLLLLCVQYMESLEVLLAKQCPRVKACTVHTTARTCIVYMCMCMWVVQCIYMCMWVVQSTCVCAY